MQRKGMTPTMNDKSFPGVRSYGQWEWPDLSALHAADWNEPCPVISAADVVEVVSEPGTQIDQLICCAGVFCWSHSNLGPFALFVGRVPLLK